MELAVPAWQGSLILLERQDLERVQRNALHIILGSEFISYSEALKFVHLDSLENRRVKLCLKFAKKAEKHVKHSKWFQINTKPTNTRQHKSKYLEVQHKLSRFKKSPISYLTRILNEHYQ